MAVTGLKNAIAGSTVCDNPEMAAFERIIHVSEPVVTVAVEAKHMKDLPKLIDTLRSTSINIANRVFRSNPSPDRICYRPQHAIYRFSQPHGYMFKIVANHLFTNKRSREESPYSSSAVIRKD